MNGLEVVEVLVDAVTTALELGDWAVVVSLTSELYTAALCVGEIEFAELVQDLHWIANDVLMHPVEAGKVVSA